MTSSGNGEHDRPVPNHSAASDGRPGQPVGRPETALEAVRPLESPEHAIEWRQREDGFRRFVENIQEHAIFMLDTHGMITSWNDGATRITGYAAGEVLGRHFSCFYTEEDLAVEKPQRLLEVAAKFGHAEDEGWRVRKDGTRFWAQVIISAIRDESGQLAGYGKLTRDITDRHRSELAMRRSEARFRLLAESVQDYAIFMLDSEGYVSTWNRGAERIKGYHAPEIIGRHFSCFYPEEEKSEKPARELEIAARDGRVQDEGWRIRKDGSRFWAHVTITAMRDESGKLIGFGKVTRDITERMLADKSLQESERRLQESERSLRELSQHLLRTQDEERRRIGREMHDTLGQSLSVLKIKIDSIKLPKELEKAHQNLSEASKLAAECVTEVRTISYLLYPPMLEDLGLSSAIAWYVDGFSERSGIQTKFAAPVEFERLPRDVELVLFRVLQEGLTNVHRHSGSKTAEVRLQRNGHSVTLEVADHGTGVKSAGNPIFEPGRDWTGAQGVGLRGMRERLVQLGGRLEMSTSKSGTLLRSTVPLSSGKVVPMNFTPRRDVN